MLTAALVAAALVVMPLTTDATAGLGPASANTARQAFPDDSDAPIIEITNPPDGAELPRGTSISIDFTCTDDQDFFPSCEAQQTNGGSPSRSVGPDLS